MKRQRRQWLWFVAAVLVGLAAGALQQREPGIRIALLLVAVGACYLGFMRRQLAWAYALTAGGGLALVTAITQPPRAAAMISLLGLVVAFIGATTGALGAWVLAPKRRRQP